LSSLKALPIAYLPGASGNSQVWRVISTYLAARRPAVCVDYPGLGGVAAEPTLITLDDLSRYLLERLPPHFDVVSLSMGSSVALRFCLLAPERVRRLVLITPAGGVHAARFGAVDWRPAFRRRRPHAPSWFLDDDIDLSAQLDTVCAPCLIVAGENDLIAPVEQAAHLRDKLRARLEVVSGATHDLDEEHPELVASLIEAHLRGNSQA